MIRKNKKCYKHSIKKKNGNVKRDKTRSKKTLMRTHKRHIHGGTKPPALTGFGFEVDLRGAQLPTDGIVYQASSVTPNYIYMGQVKYTQVPRSMTCGSDARLPCPESMLYFLHGFGRMVFLNDHGVDKIYNGQWRNNNMNGLGQMKFSNGDIYVGKFLVDKMSGHGKMTHTNGDVYDGNWANDSHNGLGTYTFNSDTRDYYNGEFIDGKFKGKGIMMMRNGDKYAGEWDNDEMNGTGKYTFNPNDEHGREFYEGDFVDGEFKGIGTMKMKNGAQYIGEWDNGDQNGSGQLWFENGDYYMGDWKDSQMHGEGTLMDEDGTILHKGQWMNNEPVGSEVSSASPSPSHSPRLIPSPNGSARFFDPNSQDRNVRRRLQ